MYKPTFLIPRLSPCVVGSNHLSGRARRRLTIALLALVVAGLAATSAAPYPAMLINGKMPVSRLRARVTNRAEMPPRMRASEGQADERSERRSSELNIERRGHVAVALDQSRVLFIGGENDRGMVKESELFDLHSRSFSLASELISPRADAVALRLADGRILVLGGRNKGRKLRSTEIYDSASNSFAQGPRMVHARAGHTATLLDDGRLIVIGGDTDGSAEILDPSTKRFSLITARLNIRRAFHSGVVLQNGKVFIAGGRNVEGRPEASAEIFDPTVPAFSLIQNSMGTLRVRPTLRVLSNGNVQVIGGDDGRSMEMFNAEGGYFTALAYLATDSNSPEDISQVLRCQTRVALIHKADRDSVLEKPGRTLLLEDPQRATGQSSDLLDRDDYTLIEISGFGTALVAGGISSAGKILSSVVAFESSAATVATDQTDYSPGETVVITGANWQAGEIVQLTLHRDNDTPDTLLSASADDSGNISNSDYVVQESDLDVTFLLTAVGQASGFTAQTTFTDQSSLITQIGFNAVSQPASFTVGVANAASSPLRVQSRNASGVGEAVTGSGNSVTVLVTSNSATGRFDTNSGGAFTATSLTLQINAGSQNTPDFFYRETTAGSVTLVATVIATAGVSNLPINSSSSIAKPVNKANTTTSVASAAANPLQCGQPVTFTATVAHAISGAAGAPTGTVTFRDSATTLGTGILSAGPIFTAAFTTSSLSLGSHSITAVYGPDSNFNGSTSAILSRTVIDDQPPVITLSGANPLTVECHMPYSEPGAIATDTCSGDLTNSIVTTGSVNPNAVGVYMVHYDVSDPTGNPALQATRIVNVVDTTPPTLSLVGAIALTIECQTSFTDPGATATDICSGDLTGSIVVAGTVNADAVGIYSVHYNVSDPAGNSALQATRTVNIVDSSPPTISLIGANPFAVECHTSFTDPGATALDSCDGLTTATPSGSVDVNVPGDYIVTYSASDASGNVAATVTRTVRVRDTTPPTITLNGASPLNVECHTTFTDPGAIANDSCDSGLTAATASGSVNINVPGDYLITYNACDASNNHAVPVTRAVHVVDTTPPVPSLTTLPMVTGECSATVSSPPSANDSCAGTLIATTADPLTYETEGTFTVHWTYDDGHGNTSTQTQTVIVHDTIAPVPILPSLAPVTGQCSLIVAAPTATDNCFGTITATTADPLTYETEGTFTVHWTYDDGHGNTSTQTQTVIVHDTIAPVPNVASLAGDGPVLGNSDRSDCYRQLLRHDHRHNR